MRSRDISSTAWRDDDNEFSIDDGILLQAPRQQRKVEGADTSLCYAARGSKEVSEDGQLRTTAPSWCYRGLYRSRCLGYFGGPAYRLSELRPGTLRIFRNNQNEILRILAYQYTFASLSVPEDLLDAGYTVWWDWEEELDDLIITVDGYQEAELARW
jgi:hypothetical protein